MSNSYAKSELPLSDYNPRFNGVSYPKFPLGKMLSIGATACAFIVPNSFSPSINDEKAIEQSVDVVEQFESSLADNIQAFKKVISAIITDKSSIVRQNILEQIMSFKSLINSWDGFGALPTSAKSAASAIRVIDGLSDQVIEEIDDFFPNTNGSVSFKWINSIGERLSLSVGADSFSYYCLKIGGSTDLNDGIQINEESIADLNDAIQSIMIGNV